METGRLGHDTSLYWLLIEPVLKGAPLGEAWDSIPIMNEALKKKRGISTVEYAENGVCNVVC